MARDAYYTVNKYANKMAGAHLGPAFSNQHTLMVVNYATYYGEICSLIDQTKDILHGQGIRISQYPYYLTYTREIYRHWKRYSGRTLYAIRDAIRDKWQAWGLSLTIMKLIDQNVFGLPPTTPPLTP